MSTLDTRVGSTRSEGTTLHVTSRSTERDERASISVSAEINTLGDVAGIGGVLHANVTTATVHSTLDAESTVGADVVGTVGVGASNLGSDAANGLVVTRQLVDTQTTSTTADLRRVTSAGSEAVSENSGLRGAVGRKSVGAEALSSVLETDVLVTLGTAVVHAAVNGDIVVVPPVVVSEGTVARLVDSTSNVVPAGEVAVVDSSLSDLSSVICASLLGSVGVLDRVAAGELGKCTGDWLRDGGRDNAALSGSVVEEVEHRAVLRATTLGTASVSGLLKGRDIPTVQKVTVEPVTSRVTLGEDEWLPVVVGSPPVEASS